MRRSSQFYHDFQHTVKSARVLITFKPSLASDTSKKSNEGGRVKEHSQQTKTASLLTVLMAPWHEDGAIKIRQSPFTQR